MRRILSTLTFFIVLWGISASVSAAGTEQAPDRKAQVNIIFNQSIDYELLRTYEAAIIHEYESIQAVTAEMNNSRISALEKEGRVKSVQYDGTVRIQAQVENWGRRSLNIEKHKTSFTGKGVNIAVIDSGIDSSHPDLNVSGGECFLELSEYPDACANGYEDDNGHGTHVAGIIAALDNDIGVVGVAPEANLYILKALNANGKGTTSSVTAAIDWAIQNKMDIINLSLATLDDDLILREIIKKAYNSNILIVAAAGNKKNVTGLEENIGFPAKYEEAIAVTALNNDLTLSKVSSVGLAAELTAPGSTINSTFPMYLQSKTATGYDYMSGTSMAAPFVSAVAALYMEKYPDLPKKSIRSLLQDTALDLGIPGRDSKFGFGLVQFNGTKTTVSATVKEETVRIQIKELPPGAEQYNLYRYDTKIVSNGTSMTIEDYGMQGNIEYRLVPIVDGVELNKEAEAFTVSLTSPSLIDIDNKDWYSRNMLYLYKEGIMRGYGSGELKPTRLITRAEAVMLLVNAIGLPIQSTASFKDVGAKSVAAAHIAAAYEHNIVNGFPDGTFRPNQPVTRAEMSILIANAYKLSEVDNKTVAFKDLTTNVASYKHIQKVVQNGIAQGYSDQTFRPYDYMNRATFSVFLSRAENELLK